MVVFNTDWINYFLTFITVWLDNDRMVHAIFDSKLFLSDDTVSAIKEHVREILFRNKKLNPNYWCTCLPYKLQNGGYHKDSLRMDYIILMPLSCKFFLWNGIDLSRENELLLTNCWYDDVILTFKFKF